MSIKSKAINSGKWVTISTLIQTFIQFAQIAVLARMLDFAAFGLVGMSTVIISLFGMMGDLGFTNSIIHKQETDRKILSTVYYLNIMLAIIMFGAVCICSPLVIAFYNEPRLGKIVITSAVCFMIICFGSIYSILLKKELRFKSIAIIDISGNVAGCIVTVYLATKGYAEMSLIYGGIAIHIVRTILEIYLGRDLFIPSFHFKFKEVTGHLKFGIFNLGETFIGFIQGNWDNIIVGKILGKKYLGIYNLALQLGYYPISKLNPLILRVAYPLIAKLKDDNSAMKKAYLKILDILSYFNYPLLAGLFITVESVVPLVYGPHWAETFPLIKIFVFVSATSCLAHPLFTIVYTKGKPKYMFYLSLVALAVKVILVFILGTYFGVIGVAIALLLTEAINLIIGFFIVQSLLGNFLDTFFKNILKPITFCLLMVLAVFAYKTFFGYQGIINTIAEVIIGGAVYLILTFKFKYTFADVKDLRKSL